MSRKLTNTDIDQRLHGRAIKRIDDYINCNSKIKFQCLVEDCNHILENTPGNILRGTRMPKMCRTAVINKRDSRSKIII